MLIKAGCDKSKKSFTTSQFWWQQPIFFSPVGLCPWICGQYKIRNTRKIQEDLRIKWGHQHYIKDFSSLAARLILLSTYRMKDKIVRRVITSNISLPMSFTRAVRYSHSSEFSGRCSRILSHSHKPTIRCEFNLNSTIINVAQYNEN